MINPSSLHGARREVSLFTPVAPKPQHDPSFWRTIVKQQYAVPEHESADALAHELSSLLESPDPELRDELAYSILSAWISRRSVLSPPTLLSLTDEWACQPEERNR